MVSFMIPAHNAQSFLGATPGTPVEMEITVEHRRNRASAVVRPLPFFDAPRKRA